MYVCEGKGGEGFKRGDCGRKWDAQQEAGTLRVWGGADVIGSLQLPTVAK